MSAEYETTISDGLDRLQCLQTTEKHVHLLHLSSDMQEIYKCNSVDLHS